MSTLNKHIGKFCKLLHELESSQLVFLFPVEQICILAIFIFTIQN